MPLMLHICFVDVEDLKIYLQAIPINFSLQIVIVFPNQ